jgi:hypothetical protein
MLPLGAKLSGSYSARLGRDWRVLYEVDDAEQGVIVLAYAVARMPTGAREPVRRPAGDPAARATECVRFSEANAPERDATVRPASNNLLLGR